MDYEIEYIEMCDKAKEIQKEWTPKNYDCIHIFSNKGCPKYNFGDKFLYDVADEDGYEFSFYNYGSYKEKISEFSYKNFAIFLPRQDQLQEMLKDLYSRDLIILNVFYKFCINDINIDKFESFEQFWLAFVMQEKYGKVWDVEKKDWRKEGTLMFAENNIVEGSGGNFNE
jgi:hypothetical protein